MTESALQSIIVKYLASKGWLVIHIPNQLARGRLTAAGILPGAPDLVCLKNGRCIFIEVKTPAGRLGQKQQEIHELIRAQNIEVYVVRSLEDLEKIE